MLLRRFWILSIIVAAWSIAATPGHAQSIAIMGQISAARYVLERIVTPAGEIGELFVESPLPVERYREHKAVVFAETQAPGEGQPGRAALWLPDETIQDLEEYVDQGGTVVLLDSRLPVPGDASVTMRDLAHLMGFSESGRVEGFTGAVSVGDAGRAFFDGADWSGVAQFPAPADGRLSAPLTRSMKAEPLLHTDGTNTGEPEQEVLPVAGTIHRFGKGKVVTLRFSPMRVRQAAERHEIAPSLSDAFDEAIAQILTED